MTSCITSIKISPLRKIHCNESLDGSIRSASVVSDTLEAIRQNFQQLYRKSFGGGHADLILEESDDPLEAGVDIVATPPGKPSLVIRSYLAVRKR